MTNDNPLRITIAEARAKLRDWNMTLRRDAAWDEYIVRFNDQSRHETGYHTNSLVDAFDTAAAMYNRRMSKEKAND